MAKNSLRKYSRTEIDKLRVGSISGTGIRHRSGEKNMRNITCWEKLNFISENFSFRKQNFNFSKSIRYHYVIKLPSFSNFPGKFKCLLNIWRIEYLISSIRSPGFRTCSPWKEFWKCGEALLRANYESEISAPQPQLQRPLIQYRRLVYSVIKRHQIVTFRGGVISRYKAAARIIRVRYITTAVA